MVTRNSPGPAPIVFETAFYDARLQKFIDDKGYVAGFQQRSPAVAGQFVGCQINNPSGSGKNVVVVGAYVSSSVAQRVDFDTPETPAEALEASTATEEPKRVGQAAAVAQVSHANNIGANPVTEPGPSIRIQADNMKYVPLGFVLEPNSSVQAAFASTGVGDLDSFFWEWYEE